MAILDIFFPFGLLGILIYVLKLAPTFPALSRPSKSHRLSAPPDTDFHIERKGFTLSVWTAGLNGLSALIVLRKGHPRILRGVYDLGSAVGVGGAVTAVGGALWALVGVWREVWRELESHARSKVGEAAEEAMGGMVKRAVEEVEAAVVPAAAAAAAVGPSAATSGLLQPLIPGITVPWSHAPTIIMALLVNQLIHELGHALAAAVDDIQMTKLSFDLHLLLPSASVSLPSSVDSLPLRSKLRLVCAGPFHNLAVYLTLGLLASTGLGKLFWKDRGREGVVIWTVAPTSALYAHVSPGELVTHLDDVFLGDKGDVWTSYLNSTVVGDDGRGWCVDKTIYASMHDPPCDKFGSVVFEPVDRREPGLSADERRSYKCFGTHPILHIPSTACPCPSQKWICVHPSHEEEILRIRLDTDYKSGLTAARGEGEVVLFAGDRREILHGVQVSDYSARGWGGLVRWYTLFLSYMSSLSLAMFFFNLLPLPHTDGSKLLRHLLSLHRPPRSPPSSPNPPPRSLTAKVEGHSPSPHSLPTARVPSINLSRQFELGSDDEDMNGNGYDDPEMGGKGGGRRRGKEDEDLRRIRRWAELGMSTVLGLWAVGWLFLGLLRSS